MNVEHLSPEDQRPGVTKALQGRVFKILCYLAVLGFISFPIVMSTHAPYDDEGYVMMTLQTFGEGAPIYGETHTQYGPGYYFLTSSIHSVFGLPLSQDAVRLKTLVFWCVSTWLCYCILGRLQVTESLRIVTSLLFHIHLNKLALEPGHPQEWILVLSLLAIWFVSGSSRGRWVMSAVCVALVGMIKLNCGAVLAVPLILEAIAVSRPEWLRVDRFARRRSKLGPLSSESVDPCEIQRLGTMVPSYSRLGTMVPSYSQAGTMVPGYSQTGNAVFVVIVTGAIVAGAIGLLTVLSGASWHDLYWGLVGQHRRFMTDFYHAIPVAQAGVVFAVVSALLLLPMFRSYRDTAFIALTLLAFACAVLAIVRDFWQPLMHGLEPRGAASWLVIVGPAMVPWLWMRSRKHMPSALVFVLGVVCLAPAIAFPTPGTQLSLATAFAWILMALCIQHSNLAKTIENAPRLFNQTAMGLSLLMTMLAVVPWCRWASNQPLIGDGVRLLRFEPSIANRENAITQAILDTKSKYLIFDGHNHNRFFFRTNLRPLTSANPTFWPRMLTEVEQSNLLHGIQECRSLCVVIPPESDALADEHAEAVRSEMRRSIGVSVNVDDWRIGSKRSD